MAQSAIICQNSEKTIFIVDIPTSINVSQYIYPSVPGIAQQNGDQKESKYQQRHILSTQPLKTPYPSPEPKTETARKRVLERIPAEERILHDDVFGPLVKDALRELQQTHDGGTPWCLPRCLVEENCRMAKKRRLNEADITPCSISSRSETDLPPLILSPGDNDFESLSEVQNVLVKNTSAVSARLNVKYIATDAGKTDDQRIESTGFTVPPQSTFLFSTLPMERPVSDRYRPIPGIPTEQKFNLILLDPPWPNRSVRRSSHYVTHLYSDMDSLTRYIEAILQAYLYKPDGVSSLKQQKQGEERGGGPTSSSQKSIAAIWVTNTAKSRKAAYDAMLRSGLSITEEWIWVKTTVDGEPVSPIDGLWRKPYEVLVIGQRDMRKREAKDQPKLRRVIAAVPDVHSRKPNLKDLFEMVFFSVAPQDGNVQGNSCRVKYSALEIFARNVTAGWWACGNEVLKFNHEEWWVEK
ncbi:MT-A70 family [Paecilomyces variotii No. 5]|uniref:MT-A70 family n=1 Tax=Byssochlamys spectabilis (strain No. 5 / NBRC 109023) TaxID=1356009 RepID=V5FZR9_BYSSN|nr:MT-A70 family [Paecilomyces variotii No. 5]